MAVEDLPDFYGSKVTSVDCLGINGDTPLHAVVHWPDLSAVKVLLSAGANVNARGEMGFTPIHYAISKKNIELVKLLIQHGARLDIKDDRGRTEANSRRWRELEEKMRANAQ